MTIAASQVPHESALSGQLVGASYVDCRRLALPGDRQWTPQDAYYLTTRPTPRWLNALLVLRDRIVGCLGLKAVGGFGATDPATPLHPDDALDIFTIDRLDQHELTLFIHDRHLNVSLSFMIVEEEAAGPALILSTVVTTHNRLGRLYMAVVGPFHRVLVKHQLRRAAHRLAYQPETR